jgi:hypothetical protein
MHVAKFSTIMYCYPASMEKAESKNAIHDRVIIKETTFLYSEWPLNLPRNQALCSTKLSMNHRSREHGSFLSTRNNNLKSLTSGLLIAKHPFRQITSSSRKIPTHE